MAVPNSSAVHFPQTGIDVRKEDNNKKERKKGGETECGRKCHVKSTQEVNMAAVKTGIFLMIIFLHF